MNHQTDSADGIRRLDPIDGVQLAAAWSDSQAKQALFEEITAMPLETLAPAPQAIRTGRVRRQFALAAGLAVVAVGLVVAQGALSKPSPAFAVKPLAGGVLEITVLPEFRDGNALAAELREHGLDVEVVAMAASPSRVGEVEIFRSGNGDAIPPGITFGADGTDDVFNWKIDPAVFTGKLTVELHVATQAGEPYQVATGAFEPGEVLSGLHCALDKPMRATDLAPYFDQLGIAARWLVISPTDDASVTYETESAAVPVGQVLWAHPKSSSVVEVTVQPDGVVLGPGQAATVYDSPCTPERAAAWE